jgi:hypothetical protein
MKWLSLFLFLSSALFAHIGGAQLRVSFGCVGGKLSVQSKEDQTQLGWQTLFLYDSPHLILKESKRGNLFINGKVMHYDQKNHFMYFKA